MKQIELVGRRKPREKHFLNADGTITAQLFDHNVHFEKNGHYEPINTKIISTGKSFVNTDNTFKTEFDKNIIGLINISKDNHYLKIFPKTENILSQIVRDNTINYRDNINDIDYKYEVQASRLKETIIFNCKETVPESIFYYVDTNLKLEIKENKLVALSNGETVFILETPYMVDSAGNKNNGINYELYKQDNIYILKLVYNLDWLKDKNRPFPVIIDPTILPGEGENVYDTYISTRNGTLNYNNYNVLDLGNEVGNIYRILLKFDLPEIGTADDIIDAKGYIVTSYGVNYDTKYPTLKEYTTVHEITKDWDEKTVTWDNFADSYNSRIEDTFMPMRNSLENPTLVESNGFNITNLVKKWYSGNPNYGILLKFYNEDFDSSIPKMSFYSKTEDINNNTNLKPFLEITYRNCNGLEDYYSYSTQELLGGTNHINNYTGNFTSICDVNMTKSRKFPIDLKLVYNTNDVILNNDWGYTKGVKFNYLEIIDEVSIDGKKYLKHLNASSSIHYFYQDGESYYDEDGLGLSAKLDNNQYIITSKSNVRKIFTKLNEHWYLTKIIDQDDYVNDIQYDVNFRIIKIVDNEGKEINIEYGLDKIIVSSDTEIAEIALENNRIVSVSRKLGVYKFKYNSNGLIKSVIDRSDIGYSIEYYDVNPYKVAKIIEVGLNNAIGNSLSFTYNFKNTILKSGTGIVNSLLFNNRGNLIGVTNLEQEIDLDNAYGQSSKYYTDLGGQENVKMNNKLIQTVNSVKYTNNLIKDAFLAFFEKSNEGLYTENHAYVLNSGDALEISVAEKEETYTFSGFFKSNSNISVEIRYTSATGTLFGPRFKIDKSLDFEKQDFSFTKPNGYSWIGIDFFVENGTGLLDYPQLEYGNTSNCHNLIRNSDFRNSLEDWSVSSRDIVTQLNLSSQNTIEQISENKKAIKLISGPTIETSLMKTINESGKKGDVYRLSFWYKNEGIEPTFKQNTISPNVAYTHLNFNHVNEFDPGMGTINCRLSYHESSWQYFSEVFSADADYKDITLYISQDCNANNLYITNVMLTRDVSYSNIQYDFSSGDVLSSQEYSTTSVSYKYDDNKNVISILNGNGIGLNKEYDVENKLLVGTISNMGIYIGYSYDENGNKIKEVLKSVKNKVNADGGNYYIRSRGTKKYLNYDYKNKIFLSEENRCNVPYFSIVKNGDYYNIKFNNKILGIINNEIILQNNSNDYSLFKFAEQDNGSYIIIPKYDMSKALYIDNNLLKVGELLYQHNYEMYFENIDSEEFIESTTTYTEDGQFVECETDSLGNKVYYEYDSVTGLSTKITNSSGVSVNYEYDEKYRLNKVLLDQRFNEVEYNQADNISKIVANNKQLSFSYDDFYNEKDIKINNKLLVTNEYYDNNHLLKKRILGNGYTKEYSYNESNLLKKYKNSKDEFEYEYNNSGQVSQIISNTENYKYYYDLVGRIIKANTNNSEFISNYKYDSDGNIINKRYKINGLEFNNNYKYDSDGKIIEIVNGNSIFSYIYDNLERIIEIKINGSSLVKYEYLGNGKRTSLLIKKIIVKDSTYEYNYDNEYNISVIKENGQIIHKFEYDNYSQLIKDVDCINEKEYSYIYDISGNILEEKISDVNDNTVIKINSYKYENEDWKDLLTQYNDINISYDEIGNATNIGNAKLSWIDGNQLSEYIDETRNLNIKYEYNLEGIRTSKTINGELTKYYLENDNVIVEKTENDMIQYLRDELGTLYGFELNGITYFYLKNIQNDIIGITDSNNNVVCKYVYDVWGNLEHLLDQDGNEINDKTNIAFKNKYRYRSYYYDEESNLYYLKTRYYSPLLKRFISSDSILSNNYLTYNLFSYCNNNPSSQTDDIGQAGFITVLKTVVDIGRTIFESFGSAVASAGWVGVAAVGTAVVVGAIDYGIDKYKSKKKLEEEKQQQKNNYSVYALTDDYNVAHYVGISNNTKRRQNEHKLKEDRKDLILVVLYEEKSYYEARAIEEALIVEHGVADEFGWPLQERTYLNKIHSISPLRDSYHEKLALGKYIIEHEPPLNYVIWKK